MRYQRLVKLLPAILASVLFLFHGNIYAAECKGASSTACSANSACTWVSGYTRKDGSKVRGYCRSKGKSGSTSSKRSSEKAEKKAKDKKVDDKKTKGTKTKDTKTKDKKVKDTKSKEKK